MVRLIVPGGVAITPASPPSTLSGVCATYVLNGNQPYPASTITLSTSNLFAASKSVPDPTATAINALLNLTLVKQRKILPNIDITNPGSPTVSNNPVSAQSQSDTPSNLAVSVAHS